VGSRSVPSVKTDVSDPELITQAQQGDRRAFGELVRRHREGVVNVVYRMCGDANLAEDAAQEAFIRAWQHLPSYRSRSPSIYKGKRSGSLIYKGKRSGSLIYKGKRSGSFALDALRRERETVDIDALPLAAADAGPEATMEGTERGERVQQAVLALPPASRAVLVLREYEGLSYREIADTLDIPIGTVMSRLNYARNRLRKSLAPYLEAL